MELSDHFSLDELTHSDVALRRGIGNQPDPAQVENMRKLCATLLEPIRWLLETPIHVTSGYRSPIVNSLVGGSVTSAHMDGRAADFVPVGVDLVGLVNAYHRIRRTDLPYDQLILECDAWIHVSMAKEGEEPRKEALLAKGGPRSWSYTRLERL